MTTTSGKDRENNMEDSNLRKRKREDSDVAEPPNKEIKCCNITDSSEPNNKSSEPRAKPVEDSSVQKRKASDDGDAPGKRRRCSSSNTIITVSSPTEPNATRSSKKKLKDGLAEDISHDNPLLEEEKIFEMASSGKTSRAEFEDKYVQQAPLGSGGFGSVYAGVRKEDLLPVAIKHIPRKKVLRELVVCNGKKFNVIVEVALMLKAAGLPGSVGQSAVISLLDWYTLKHELILVLERPAISMDLHTYRKAKRGSLPEDEAKMILRQMVDAAIDMHAKGVFHRDIKLENTLIQRFFTGGPRIRVIDFGCGTLSSEMPYTSFCGTPTYAPPELFSGRMYFARATTVWQLGALFYSLLHREHFSTPDFVKGYIKINSALSQDTKTLLDMCLVREPAMRATLEELQSCPALR